MRFGRFRQRARFPEHMLELIVSGGQHGGIMPRRAATTENAAEAAASD